MMNKTAVKKGDVNSNGTPASNSRVSFPDIEKGVQGFWKEDETFHKSLSQEGKSYVFYDGPPFANGLPHHGHLLTGYVKDVVPRFQSMNGRHVERKFGWDCHGLPAEMEAQKSLNVSSRKEIHDLGIEKFNEECATTVLRYTDEWKQVVSRQARWVDFDGGYKTMDLDYMESTIWAFKSLYDKGLIYEADRVMPYSWAAETPLSNFEIRLDDATRLRQDQAATVSFKMEAGFSKPVSLLAWTTTPWTLPSNLALGVSADLEYSFFDFDDSFVCLASDCISKYEEFSGLTPAFKRPGSFLVGLEYVPMFSYFEELDAFKILDADFVTTEVGTGVVHLAPGFGEDDQRVSQAAGLPLVVPVDDEGCFTSEVSDFVGRNVFEANSDVVRFVKSLGFLFRVDSYEHNYPHCWRTDEPVMYKAMKSWYVDVLSVRDRMVELADDINWVPDHVKEGRFGKWIENARDWSISRDRFWGAPVPVWTSDNPEFPRVDVYGSLDELEAAFGVRPESLHRPYIDNLTRLNPDDPSGKSVMRRVPQVLDCWFESGAMPFAQVHYPFENKETFEANCPADFVVEYVNQTRGWFYTMHVLAVALFDRPAYKNVLCHGVLLAEDGQKLSKKLRNYTEPSVIFERQGSDALRWYLLGSNVLRGGDARIDDKGVDEVVKKVLLPLYNACSFFEMYSSIDGYDPCVDVSSSVDLDRYILAKLGSVTDSVTTCMHNYDLPGAITSLGSFIDVLNNWYIRRSRTRFWGEGLTSDKVAAYNTLYSALLGFLRLSAPFLPFLSEHLFQKLTGGGTSVHLSSWPSPEEFGSDERLVSDMDAIRDVVSSALYLREQHGLRVRLPLGSLTVSGVDAEYLADLVKDEVNVKEVFFKDSVEEFVKVSLSPNGNLIGPRLGSDARLVFKGAKEADWSLTDSGVVVAGFELFEGEFSFVASARADNVAVLPSFKAAVVLDVEVTDELEQEGLARDFVRLVQESRRSSDLLVSDRVTLVVCCDSDLRKAIESFEEFVCAQTLCVGLTFGVADDFSAGEHGSFSIAAVSDPKK